jgi:hypothetical protein
MRGSKKDIEPRLEDSNEIFEIAAEWYGTYRMTWPLSREQRKRLPNAKTSASLWQKKITPMPEYALIYLL